MILPAAVNFPPVTVRSREHLSEFTSLTCTDTEQEDFRRVALTKKLTETMLALMPAHLPVEPVSENGWASWHCQYCDQPCASDNPCDCCSDDIWEHE